jgi:hypothetical protein
MHAEYAKSRRTGGGLCEGRFFLLVTRYRALEARCGPLTRLLGFEPVRMVLVDEAYRAQLLCHR